MDTGYPILKVLAKEFDDIILEFQVQLVRRYIIPFIAC